MMLGMRDVAEQQWKELGRKGKHVYWVSLRHSHIVSGVEIWKEGAQGEMGRHAR